MFDVLATRAVRFMMDSVTPPISTVSCRKKSIRLQSIQHDDKQNLREGFIILLLTAVYTWEYTDFLQFRLFCFSLSFLSQVDKSTPQTWPNTYNSKINDHLINFRNTDKPLKLICQRCSYRTS